MAQLRLARFPWILQVVLTLLGALWCWWFGLHAHGLQDELRVSVQTWTLEGRQDAWAPGKMVFAHRQTDESGFQVSTGSLAVGGLVVLAVFPSFVWLHRCGRKPEGYFCSQCFEALAEASEVALFEDFLVCPECARRLEEVGIAPLARFQPARPQTVAGLNDAR